jgi:hypothetical protein
MPPKLDSFEKACLRADFERASRTAGNGGMQAFLPVLSSAMFVSLFDPPEYIVAGILQRRFVYALTGATGAGKTAIMLTLAAHVALGRNISPQYEVKRVGCCIWPARIRLIVRCAGLRWRSNSISMPMRPGRVPHLRIACLSGNRDHGD